jgi:hypothetical protein
VRLALLYGAEWIGEACGLRGMHAEVNFGFSHHNKNHTHSHTSLPAGPLRFCSIGATPWRWTAGAWGSSSTSCSRGWGRRRGTWGGCAAQRCLRCKQAALPASPSGIWLRGCRGRVPFDGKDNEAIAQAIEAGQYCMDPQVQLHVWWTVGCDWLGCQLGASLWCTGHFALGVGARG